ncbi:response regulator transcription factor [Nesterenkonia muleiensis]|uniref:response regulator transcription factor n=1 Tax=Nesterenkonia muleiensis TaxID=2282648 RepID=UPI000E74064D|nr:response regulator transcription factor [Nesterenkonia muleiensis]
MIRAVIVDDHPLIRETLRQYVETSADIECVGEAADGQETISLALELEPDVVLMDLNLPVKDGISATYDITRSSTVRVLVFSALETDQDVLRALQAGARGYMTKRAAAHDVLHAIRLVHQGDLLFAPDIAELLQVNQRSSQGEVKRLLQRLVSTPRLSGRELSVLQGVCRGLTNQAIADELVIQLSTVNTYITRLNKKLGTHTKIDMYIQAVKEGIIPSPFAERPTEQRL